jgi:anaerobic sulfite reductase subunit B
MTAEPRVHVLLDVVPETPGVVTLCVAPVDGPPERFEPAQFGMLGAFGIGEAAISISSSSSVLDHHEYTIRQAGAITTALHRLRPGDQFCIRGPFGRGWNLDAAVGDVVVAAGGIGLAPLRSAILALAERGVLGGSGRRVIVVVGARRSADLLYRGQYDDWRASGIEVIETIDAPEDGWSGRIGLVTEVVGGLDVDWSSAGAMVCGPDVMMRVTGDLFVDLGMPADRVQLTLERNMHCGIGRCGHCQLGPTIICRDGPVMRYSDVADAMGVRER